MLIKLNRNLIKITQVPYIKTTIIIDDKIMVFMKGKCSTSYLNFWSKDKEYIIYIHNNMVTFSIGFYQHLVNNVNNFMNNFYRINNVD